MDDAFADSPNAPASPLVAVINVAPSRTEPAAARIIYGQLALDNMNLRSATFSSKTQISREQRTTTLTVNLWCASGSHLPPGRAARGPPGAGSRGRDGEAVRARAQNTSSVTPHAESGGGTGRDHLPSTVDVRGSTVPTVIYGGPSDPARRVLKH